MKNEKKQKKNRHTPRDSVDDQSMINAYIYSIKILQVFKKSSPRNTRILALQNQRFPRPRKQFAAPFILQVDFENNYRPSSRRFGEWWMVQKLSFNFFGGDIHLNKNKKTLSNNNISLKFTVSQGDLIHVDS